MTESVEIAKDAYTSFLPMLEASQKIPLPTKAGATPKKKNKDHVELDIPMMRFQSIFSPWPHRLGPDKLLITCVGFSIEGLKEGIAAGVKTLFLDQCKSAKILSFPSFGEIWDPANADEELGIQKTRRPTSHLPMPEPWEPQPSAEDPRYSMFVYIAEIDTPIEPAKESQFPTLVSARSDLDLCFALRAWSALSITSCKTSSISR